MNPKIDFLIFEIRWSCLMSSSWENGLILVGNCGLHIRSYLWGNGDCARSCVVETGDV